MRSRCCARRWRSTPHLRLFGNNGQAAEFEGERLCLTTSLVADADPPAQTRRAGCDRVAITTVDRKRADSDADGTVNNCEWAVFVGGVAAQQGFARLQGQATGACESGLQKVLDDGVARCDQDRQDGLGRLGDGQKVALGVGLLTAEFQAAIENCKPKLFVTPPSATVEIGQTVSFSARTNEGDTDFDWTASDGTVDGGGTFTAPSKPGHGDRDRDDAADPQRQRDGDRQVPARARSSSTASAGRSASRSRRRTRRSRPAPSSSSPPPCTTRRTRR